MQLNAQYIADYLSSKLQNGKKKDQIYIYEEAMREKKAE
jgi:hypothetical protein